MPILKEPDFKNHIAQKQYSNLYFISGDEKMLVGNYTDMLIKKLMGNNPPEFNFHIFQSDCDISDLSVACDVAPFMSEINCVKLVDYDIDDALTEDIDALVKVLSNIPETTVFVMTMPTLPPPEKPSKKYKAITSIFEKKGIVATLDRRGELSLERTLCKWASELGSKMTQLTAAKLISTCSNDLNILHNEVAKLCAYANEQEITEQMVDLLVAKNLEAKIFDLFDYVISQNLSKALNVVDALFYHREEPIGIVTVLSKAYVDMYRARIAQESGVPMKIFADNLSYKNRAWVLDKVARQSRNISTVSMRQSIDAILEVNERLVSVKTDQRVEIEKLISRLVLIARGTQDAPV